MNEIGLKIILVGDTNVGKTSLLLRYTDELFPNKHISTVGVEYRIKKLEYKGFRVKMQIWETAGQERFHSITKSYFNSTDGILFVFDISDYKSFEEIKAWIIESEEIVSDFKKLLIGNKCDLKHKIAVTKEEVNNYCKEKNIEFLETSAKENINLNEVFNKIIELIFKDKTDNEIIKIFGVRNQNLCLINEKKKKKKDKDVKCC